jgi:glutamate 5-kinase
METKLIAAEIATAAGVATIISHSLHPERILAVIEYNNALRRPRCSGTPRDSHNPNCDCENMEHERLMKLLKDEPSDAQRQRRPLHGGKSARSLSCKLFELTRLVMHMFLTLCAIRLR